MSRGDHFTSFLIDFKVGFSCQITHVARAKNNIIKSAGCKFFEIFGIQIKQKCRFITNECLIKT